MYLNSLQTGSIKPVTVIIHCQYLVLFSIGLSLYFITKFTSIPFTFHYFWIMRFSDILNFQWHFPNSGLHSSLIFTCLLTLRLTKKNYTLFLFEFPVAVPEESMDRGENKQGLKYLNCHQQIYILPLSRLFFKSFLSQIIVTIDSNLTVS